MDRPRSPVDALDGAERHEDASPRRKEASRCGEKAGHHPALLLDAEIRGAPDLAVRGLDTIAEDLRAVARKPVELRKVAKVERARAAPLGLPPLC